MSQLNLVGVVGQENIADAIYWFRKAAEQGHKDAIDRLAELGIQ